MSNLLLNSVVLLRRDKDSPARSVHDSEEHGSAAETPEYSQLCCALCHSPVTSQDQLLEVNGSSVHHKINPSGAHFEIICFANAEGCSASGTLTSEHSWFSGYQWCFAHCRQCSSQLGWKFKGASEFYALVSSALIPCEWKHD